MNQTDLASKLGLSKGTVSQQVKRGMPTTTVEAAQAWRKANIDPARKKGQRADQHRQAAPSHVHQAPTSQLHGAERTEGFESARTRKTIAEADQAEMVSAIQRNEYLRRDDFERYLFNSGRMLRDQLTNCSRRIGAEVAGLKSADECEAVIYREHRIFLSDFAKQLRTTIQVEIENNPLNGMPKA